MKAIHFQVFAVRTEKAGKEQPARHWQRCQGQKVPKTVTAKWGWALLWLTLLRGAEHYTVFRGPCQPPQF